MRMQAATVNWKNNCTKTTVTNRWTQTTNNRRTRTNTFAGLLCNITMIIEMCVDVQLCSQQPGPPSGPGGPALTVASAAFWTLHVDLCNCVSTCVCVCVISLIREPSSPLHKHSAIKLSAPQRVYGRPAERSVCSLTQWNLEENASYCRLHAAEVSFQTVRTCFRRPCHKGLDFYMIAGGVVEFSCSRFSVASTSEELKKTLWTVVITTSLYK